ncbi:MAG: hypothetical protein D6768_12630 [Chloroflexi bacterium]|nr:MAG: hypothetical protein D6768_12630 [Chloroflexota bacterium]
MEKIRRVKARHQNQLLGLANVVGIGVGLKETGGLVTDQPAVIVNVSQKLPLSQLDPADVVPPLLDGVLTDVQATGQFSAFKPDDATQPAASAPDNADSSNTWLSRIKFWGKK